MSGRLLLNPNPGTRESLKKAVRAGDEIWIFLDSIDEARLSDPRAFEKALKAAQAAYPG